MAGFRDLAIGACLDEVEDVGSNVGANEVSGDVVEEFMVAWVSMERGIVDFLE